MSALDKSRYRIEAVANTLQVLEVLEDHGGALSLREIIERTGLTRSAVFRILATLEERRWVEQAGRGQYRRRTRRKIRIGHAMEYGVQAFSKDVARGIEEAADAARVDLVLRDNCYDGEVALANARFFVKEKVDAVIQFQGVESMAPIIAHLFGEAGIPCVALEIPQPGAVFFGANNYHAGLLGGRALGKYAQQQWGARFDKLLLIEERQTGPLVQARIAGTVDGLREVLGDVPDDLIERADGRGTYDHAREATREMLVRIPRNWRVLLSGQNDPSVLGSIDALLEAGHRRDNLIAVVQNATRDARDRMREPNSPIVASVGYFPERYGRRVIPLVLDWLNGVQPAPALYTDHVVIERADLDRYYPEEVASAAAG